MRLLLGILLFGIWASFARYWYVCKIKDHCEPKQEIVEPETPERLSNLSLQFGDEPILEGYNQFYFQEGISKPTLDSSNMVFLDAIAEYMIDNEDKKLQITGRFLESEIDITVGLNENLGIARAKEIRRKLIELGIPEFRILIDHSMVDGDTLEEPLVFEILNLDDIGSGGAPFTFYNMTITESNFQFDSDVFEPKESFLLYADSMNIFFGLNPDKKLTIIGHTDKIGREAYNKDLGFRRAESARLYLINQVGLEADIETKSQGEKEPLDKSGTEEARAKNRRVNFKIE